MYLVTTVAMMILMATHGTIKEFSCAQESWTVYVECLEQYLAANRIEDADQQRAVLLSVCGPAVYLPGKDHANAESMVSVDCHCHYINYTAKGSAFSYQKN